MADTLAMTEPAGCAPACPLLRHRGLLVVALFAVLALYTRSWEGDLHGDPLHYAAIAKCILSSGDWLSMHDGPDLLYARKPPLMFWLTAVNFKLFGASTYTAKFWSIAFGVGTCLLIFLVGRRLFGETAGLLAGVMMATFPGVVPNVIDLRLDSAVAFFTVLAVYGVVRATQEERPLWLLVPGLAAGLGMMIKPSAALHVAVLSGLLLAVRRPRMLAHPCTLGAVALAAAIAAPWHLAMMARHGSAFTDAYFSEQIGSRVAPGLHIFSNAAGYLGDVAVRALPWWPVAAYALVRRGRAGAQERAGMLAAGLWFVAILLLMAVPPKVYDRYMVPGLPGHCAAGRLGAQQPALREGAGARAGRRRRLHPHRDLPGGRHPDRAPHLPLRRLRAGAADARPPCARPDHRRLQARRAPRPEPAAPEVGPALGHHLLPGPRVHQLRAAAGCSRRRAAVHHRRRGRRRGRWQPSATSVSSRWVSATGCSSGRAHRPIHLTAGNSEGQDNGDRRPLRRLAHASHPGRCGAPGGRRDARALRALGGHGDPAPAPLLPPAGETIAGAAPFRFAVLGDSRGNQAVFEDILERIRADKAGLVLHTGDIVREPKAAHFAWILHELDEQKLDALFCPVAGNHDIEETAPTLAERYRLYERSFGQRQYWFTYADALFVAFDNAQGAAEPDDLKWLDATLTRYRDAHRLCFVFMHEPPRDPRNAKGHRLYGGEAELIAILSKHQVSAAFASHIHGYLEDNLNGVPEYISGGAGASLDMPEAGYHYLLCSVAADGTFKVEKHNVANRRDDDYVEYVFRTDFPASLTLLAGSLLVLAGLLSARGAWPTRKKEDLPS